ncbi:hypothetical protein [Sulfuriflexus sp.]|uniref:hypothetical protein n=1 Tax=Sulfuriflexus sp. TaxID=2015443 RepID=UPI0028CF6FD9|nr:hypothetical protein [Sulfuriflexus sp.]MDT8405474.1 hypothetical protein [Sulfuriflexus sp.]
MKTMLKAWLAGLIKPYKKWEPWPEEMMFWVERELRLMDDSDSDYHRLYAQYVINQFKPVAVIRTNKDYENVVINLGKCIRNNIDNPPVKVEYPQIFRNIRTLKELLEAKNKGITHVRGTTAYNGCNTCKEVISGKTYPVDYLIMEYQKPDDSRSSPIVIPHPGCTTDCYDEAEGHGYCRCSWTEIPPCSLDVDQEFTDWLDKLI